MSDYQSILAQEIEGYLQLYRTCGLDYRRYVTVLRKLDAVLCANDVTEKVLTEALVLKWMQSINVKPYTRYLYTVSLIQFSQHLNSLGFTSYIPETPKKQSGYTPYIYTKDEWKKIIGAADNLVIKGRPESSIQMPMLLRMLYGCGLRVSETLSLQAGDVETEKGVLFIRIAKKKKQRMVPMDASLTAICDRYIRMLNLKGDDYLFQAKSGNHQNLNWANYCFRRILAQADIQYQRNIGNHDRGPCMHCLRHTFVLKSMMKSAENGRIFDETVPFLSTYLGHDSVRETDKYLNFCYELYAGAAEQINSYTNDFFPEVTT